MKIFCIGMFKTGTTSMGRAFEILGFKTLNGPWTEDNLIYDPWYKNSEKWKDNYDLIRYKTTEFDAFQDYPWMFLYKELDKWYPDAKFILTVRDAEKVAESDLNMFRKYNKELPQKQPYIDRYNTHYKSVTEHFKNKSNLLVINLGESDEWTEICDFLNLPIPKKPFPHKNKGNYGKEFVGKTIFRKVKMTFKKKKR